jgi:hypothetical protein
MAKPTGRPNGRPPKPATIYHRQVGASLRSMAEALEDATDGLVDKARGIRLLQVIDITGHYRALPEGRARELATQPEVVEAALVTGQARIYAYPPDLDAIKTLMDRIMGKVPTVVEIDLRARLEQTQADHTLLARVIREHVPDQYLGPVLAEVERIARRRAADEAAV